MIYFDNAATGGTKPSSVVSAVKAAIRVCANPGRSGHSAAVACAKTVEKTRELLASVFEAPDPDRVIFTKNCTEGLNAFLFGFLKDGDHVVVTPFEHNSVLRPLQHLKRLGKIEYDVCNLKDGVVTPESIVQSLKENTRLVAVTAASNVTGTIFPLREIRQALPKSVFLLCDGAQGGGHIPLSFKKDGFDALCLAGHKGLFALQGSGALLFSDRVEISPLTYGGTGSESLSLNMPEFYPDALEAGTISYPAVVSLLEGTRYYLVHRREIETTLLSLSARCCEGITAMKKQGFICYSKPNVCGICAFSLGDVPSEEVASLLSERYGFAVRGGLHCAPLAHRALGTIENGLVRASFSPFDKKWQIDGFLSALSEIAALKNAD